MNTFGFDTALQLMRKGREVRRDRWPKSNLLQLKDGALMFKAPSCGLCFWARPTEALLATDWSVVGVAEEPSKGNEMDTKERLERIQCMIGDLSVAHGSSKAVGERCYAEAIDALLGRARTLAASVELALACEKAKEVEPPQMPQWRRQDYLVRAAKIVSSDYHRPDKTYTVHVEGIDGPVLSRHECRNTPNPGSWLIQNADGTFWTGDKHSLKAYELIEEPGSEGTA